LGKCWIERSTLYERLNLRNLVVILLCGSCGGLTIPNRQGRFQGEQQSRAVACTGRPPPVPSPQESDSAIPFIRVKRIIIPHAQLGTTMAVHRISLFGALLLVLVAIVLLILVGPFALLILILAGVLLWYAFGPGRIVVASSN
jgi:hypothetical protein